MIAHVTVPWRGMCLNIDYEGEFSVTAARATLVPSKLVVGDLDVMFLVGTQPRVFEATDVPDPVLARQLQNLDKMDVIDGIIRLRFRDRWGVW
jgi:hypothetical protein